MKGSRSKQGAGGPRRKSAAGKRPAKAAGARSAAGKPQREAAVRYRTLLESLDTAVLLMRGAECVDCNPATLTLFGLSSRDEILGKTPLDFAPQKQPGGRDSAEMVRENVELALKKGLHIFEWQAFRKSGERFIMEVRFTPYRIGQEQYFQCIAIDITERKRAEQELAEREALLRQIQDTASVAIFLVDKQGRITHANRRMAEMFACSGEELIGSEYVAYVHPAEREIGRQKMLDLLASKIPSVALERLYWRKDGTEFWGHLVGRRFHDVHGKEIGLIGVITDITERKQAEEARRQSEEKFRLLVETSYDWIWEVDSHGVYTYASPRLRDLLGYAPDEVVGKTPFDLMPPDERERVTDAFREIVRRREPLVGLENTNLHKDGRRVVLETSGLPIFNDAGEFKGYRGIDRDITYRKQAEESLRESESRTRSIIESTPVGMHRYRLEPGGRLVFTGANPAADRILGVDNRIFVGKTIEEAFPPLAETEVPRRYREVVETGMTWQTESIEYRDNAIAGAFEVHAFRTGPDSMVAAFEDITVRKRAEEALRIKDRAIATSNSGIALANKEGILTYVNKAFLDMWGYAAEQEVLGLPASGFWVRPEEALQVIVEAASAGQWTGEMDARRRDGSAFPVQLSAGVVKDDKGNPVCLMASFIDITERRRSEDALRLSRAQLQANLDNTPTVAVQWYDAAGRVLYWNPASEAMYGWSSAEVLGRTLDGFIHTPEEAAAFVRILAGVGATGKPFGPYEAHIRRRDGTEGWVLATAFSMPMGDGKPGFVCMDVDITERKRMEEALRASEERFRDLAESLPLTVFEMDLQGRFTYVNRAACETFGYTQQDVYAGLTMPQVISPADRERARMVMARRVAGDLDGYVEYQGLRKDGTTFPITVASSPIIRDGRPAGLRGIVSDLTERRALDEERLKTQKLESIGTLAGGIAHDFNNLMQGVFGYIAMAKLTHDQREKSLAMLEQAEKALHQSVSLTSQLLTFSKGGKPLKKTIDLRPVVEDAARFALSGSRVRAEMLFADDLWPADADAGQIGQVVQNLVLNADQAMPEGGVVRVSVGNAAASGQPHGLAAGKYVRIAIQDSGVGIPEQYLEKIFDPYFTTKEKGSGLGLATSYSIVRNHGGIIEVSSEPGMGSVFSVYLPAASAAPGQSASPPGTGAARKGRVLVMDDEELVRRVAYEMLTGLGHAVELAGHGEEAVERYRQAQASGRPFAVVILDLTVRGGMGGAEAVKLLRELDPAVRAVVSSGYSDDAVIADHREHGFQAYLKKPYDIEDLRRTLQALIG